ncbi:MAG: ArsB/NhaD family transporter [Candidatus ainarchaeum sp.]|nr:ArsB/NhaD family transporter [Candidatus ainarchaeum sp.]
MNHILILLLIFLISTALTIFLILKKPTFNFKLANKEYQIESYFFGAMLGPILIILFKLLKLIDLETGIKGTAQLQPLGILILFLSMVFISIFLDITGFFEYCAKMALKISKKSGLKLFISLYVIVSILTIFTSNDIVILTFTPFVYYFTKNARINPLPFLIAEFFAANTWSMMLFIGNPTNILLATAFNISFDNYLKWMFLPTIFAGITNFLLLYFIFKKEINKEIQEIDIGNPKDAIKDKLGVFVGLVSLFFCIVVLAFSQLLGLKTWVVSVIFASVLLGFIVVRDLIKIILKKNKEKEQIHKNLDKHIKESITKETLNKIPWSVVPFVLSLFITVYALNVYGITKIIGNYITSLIGSNIFYNIFAFGFGSAFVANILNNIPMSVAFVPIISTISGSLQFFVTLAVIVGSNLGANITPIGALAGIMWLGILKSKDFSISFLTFIKYGFIVTIVTLFVTLLTLFLEIMIFV